MKSAGNFALASLFALMLFIAGAAIGQHFTKPPTTETLRFDKINDRYAFDRKTGRECDMDGVDVPKGIILDIPRCAELAKM